MEDTCRSRRYQWHRDPTVINEHTVDTTRVLFKHISSDRIFRDPTPVCPRENNFYTRCRRVGCSWRISSVRTGIPCEIIGRSSGERTASTRARRLQKSRTADCVARKTILLLLCTFQWRLTSVQCAVHGRPTSSNTPIRYGLAGMNVANDQKKKNSIMNKNGRLSSGVQRLVNVSNQPCRRLASISMSAVKWEKKSSIRQKNNHTLILQVIICK